MSEYKIGDHVIAIGESTYEGRPTLSTLKIEDVVYRDGKTPLYRSGKRVMTEDEIQGLVPTSFAEAKQLDTNERAKVLSEAEQLINGDRAQDYGDPETNFGRLAKLWAPILGTEITPVQVSLCLTQLKISRLINTPDHRDSFIDAAGYIALGAELAKEQK